MYNYNGDTSSGGFSDVSAALTDPPPAVLAGSNDAGVATSNSGVAIAISYDSSTSSAPAAFFTDVQAVVNFFEGEFNNIAHPVSFTLHVGYGEVNGTALGPGALGESNYFLHSYTYSQIRTALISAGTPGSSTLPAIDPDPSSHTWWVADTEGEALGLFSGTINMYVGFADASHATFDYDRSNGIAAGQYDFIGTVAHEISEVLGRQLGVNENDINNAASVFIADLFHYSSPGTRDWSRGGYFSDDGGVTDLGNFNTSGSGDAGDWGGATTNDSFLAFSNSGVYNDITPNDIQMMNALGYSYNDDYGNDPNFAGEVSVNGSVTGRIDYSGDRDWFRVFLNAGTSYRFDENGAPSGQGTLPDAYLRLYNSSSTLVAADDDSFNGGTFSLDSRLFYTPSTSGYYYVSAGAFADFYTGTYTIHVTPDDYDDSILTTGTVAVEGNSIGSINTAFDSDWFAVTLTAGLSYIIREDGSFTGVGTLSDPYLALYNSSGTFLTANDDGGPGLDSRIVYTPTTTGTYYVAAGAFSSHTGTYQVSVTLASLPAGNDFNDNYTSDILLANGGNLGDWLITNGTLSGGGGIAALPAGWSLVGTGDFNGDQTTDLLLQDGAVLGDWLIKNGALAGGTGMVVLPPGWSYIGTGDFNGDGTTDLLLQTGAALADWTIENSAFQSGHSIGTLPSGWNFVGTGDFNGDGTTDLLLQDGSYLGDWFIQNGTLAGGANIGVLPAGWSVVGTGDFNGDGTTDLLLQDGSFLGDWFIRNGTLAGGANIGVLPAGWSVVGTGDYNHDGTTDLLLQDGSFLGDWFIQNGTLAGGANVGVLPSGWSPASTGDGINGANGAALNAGAGPGGIAADPSAAALAAATAQLVQAMASFGASAAVDSAPGAVLGGADASQQPHLTIPH